MTWPGNAKLFGCELARVGVTGGGGVRSAEGGGVGA